MPNDYREETRKIMLQYMAELEKKDKKVYLLLANKWNIVLSNLESQIKRLSQLPAMTPNQIVRMAIYKEFVSTVEQQLLTYAQYSAKVITAGQKEFALLGLESVNKNLSLFNVSFQKLPIEAVTDMIGRTAKGTPLEKVLIKRYSDNFEQVKDVLIQNISLGINPIPTARLMNELLNGDLYISTRIARTEMINAFRESSRDGYIKSGIVKGLNLNAEPDACPVCLAVEAKNPYPLDYTFPELHPNCRCSFSPVL